MVSDGAIKFDAYCDNTAYRVGQSVYVMVPKGDYSQQKIILGKYTAMNSTPFVYTEPLDTMIEIKGKSFTGTNAMVANGTEPDAETVTPTVTKIYAANGPFVGFDRLGVSADFQVWLAPFDTAAGSYGFRLYLYTDETDTSTGESKERIYSMTLSNSDMYGNPYNFEGFFTQSKVFDIGDINNITKVEIYMFQNGDFIDGNQNYIPHGSVLSDTHQFQVFSDNIFIKNVKLLVGYDENDFDKDTIILYSDSSPTYNNKNEDAVANKKIINARWIHKREDGKFELLEQTDDVNTKLNWYRYNYGSPAADQYSGVYWERVNTERTVEADTSAIIKNLNTYYFMFYPGNNETTYIKGMQVPYTDGQTYTIYDYDRSLLRYWTPECLAYYGLTQDTANKAWAYTSISSLHVDSQTWSEIFSSRMVWHESNYIDQVRRNIGYADAHIGGAKYPVGCMHPISFWELFTTAYKFYWTCPEEFKKINFNGEVFNGGNVLGNWEMYRGKNPYTELSYDSRDNTVYLNGDHTPFTLGTNNQAFKNLLISFTNSFGEWALIEDDYSRKNFRPVDNDVYAYLYGQTQEFFAKMDNPIYTYSSDFFDYYFDPDITKQQEQIKCIGLVRSGDVNGNPTYTPYFSNLITFQNEQEVASQATIDAASALQIVCEDGSDGNYFIYDQNGKLNSDGEGRGKSRTMRVLYHGAEIDATTGITKIEWHIPKDYSMMAVDEDEHCATANKVESFYEGTRRSYTSIERFGNNLRAGTNNVIKSQQYYITDYWAQEYSNNTVECIATIDGVEYTAVKEFKFGKAGTTGTNVTFVLSFEGNRNSLNLAGLTSNDEPVVDLDDDPLLDVNGSAITAAGVSDAFANIQAKLYDAANTELNLASLGAEVQWGWKDNYNNSYMNILTDPENQYRVTVNLLGGRTTVPTDNYAILQATLKNWVSTNGSYDLIAFLPIPIKLNNTYKYISGTKEVIYDSTGTPQYSALPYQLYEAADERVPDLSWNTVSPNKTSSIGNKFKYYHEIKETKSGFVFQALNFYVTGGSDACCVYATNNQGQVLWSQPILITQNQYDFSMLNQWDGNLTIDENNGTILSKMVGAGKKNAEDNTFSGVLMGDVQSGTENNLVHETGIYGFDHGVMSFQLKESGKAIFGASGRGQITIDGNKGTIESASYNNSIENERKGMSIDLDDGILDIIDKTQIDEGNRRLEILIQPKNPFFKVTSPRGTNLINIGTTDYYLRSDNYVPNTEGLNLDLKNGRLDAFNFKLVSGKVVFDSTEGDHPYFYVRNRNDTNYLIYLGPDNNFIASNNYVSGSSGMMIDLENSRIIGRGLYIQGTSSGGSNFTLNASDGSYPLTVGSYFKVDWSGKMDATQATLEQATINHATINDATIKNLNGGTNVNINENFTVDPSGNCTANSLNASQGGTIGPYSIGSGALTGNGITLGKNFITIGGITLEAGACANRLYVSAGGQFNGNFGITSGNLSMNGGNINSVGSINFGSGDSDGGGNVVNAEHVAHWDSVYRWYHDNGWRNTSESDYLKKSDASDYATKSWVNQQGFITSVPSHGHSHEIWIDGTKYWTETAYPSSQRYKENINSLELNLDNFIPVEYKYTHKFMRDHDDDRVRYGFIAEELEQVNPDLVIYNEEGQPDAIDYQSIIALCVKEIQDLKKEINELKEKIK